MITGALIGNWLSICTRVLQAKRSCRSLADVAKDFGYGGSELPLKQTERTASRSSAANWKCLAQKADTDLKRQQVGRRPADAESSVRTGTGREVLMLKLEQAGPGGGKYDAARLTNLVDATILTTDGSRVFRDKELQNMLKRIAAAQGLIILTDSDDAGFRIRHFVTGLVGAEHVLQAYVPAVHGKEACKQAPGARGCWALRASPMT